MKALKGKILVWVDMQQKSDSRVELGSTGIELVVNSAFGSDGTVKNPTLCRRYVGSDGDVGELLLVHHNTFDMVSRGEQDDEGNWGKPYVLGDTGVRMGGGRVWLFSISEDMVQLILNDDGTVKGCMPGWILVERAKSERVVKGGVVVEMPWLQNVWRVRQDCAAGKRGQLLVTYMHSGSEVKWTFGGKQRSAWKLKEVDVLGLAGEGLLKQVK